MKEKRGNSRAQITIFIIIAILIVFFIVGYFLLKDRIKLGIPREVLPVYDYFISCVEDETKTAVSIMESQAGYLEIPEFEPGSEYMPFSSHLNFLGIAVPYWYYISGNGIAKDQMPNKEKMELQLKNYLKEKIAECSFEEFERQGFIIKRKEPEVNVDIKDTKINIVVEMPLSISFGSVTMKQTEHKISVNSKLGKFYDIARKIYDKEKAEMFLENYGVDVLRLYAPVDGVEITCSPKIWLKDNIKEELKNALEANVQAIKIKGDYYSLTSPENKYFIQDLGERIEENVNFLYSKQWPTKIEIYSDDPMMAEPVGLQEGLGILGFCFVPYHFVYDMAYPVLVQIYDNEEMFQFPLGVVIDKNKPLEGENVESLQGIEPELCQHKLTTIDVYTYNTKLEPVEASISFKCFGTSCDIGETKIERGDAYLSALFPQCVNGFIIAKADGYSTKKYMVSTVESTTVDIVLDKEYSLDLEVEVNGKKLSGERAVIYFEGAKNFVIAYPEQKEVKLSEGQYNITAYIYKNSTLSLGGFTTQKCIEVPETGIFGIFGSTKEKCFSMNIPAQTISFAISGGGKTSYYFVESELSDHKKLKIKAENLPQPTSIEQLQDNYNLLEEKTLWLELI